MMKTGDFIIKNLIDALVKEELGPGDKLPSMENLAKMSETSILSVREAVQNLATLGILEISHGRGVFVTDGAPVIEELLDARRTLESYFAMMAAQHCNAEMLQDLELLLQDMDRSLSENDIATYSEKDFDFHYSIAKAARNRILFKTLSNIRNLLQYQLYTVNRIPTIMERSTLRHREIFKAIQKKDQEQARALMWQHITEIIETWKRDVVPAKQKKETKQP
jgi:GntR family transcriptional regulator, transcriptional repressor for pyruvate dehydrogenase complex